MNTPLLLLHGALGAASQMKPLRRQLPAEWQVHTLNFPGHGGRPLEGPYSIDAFAGAVLRYLDEQNLPQAHVFGYSMGGYAALYLARRHADRLRQVFTLGTKFDWTPETATREVALLNPDKIEEKVPQFARMLAERHAPTDWREVAGHTAALLLELGNGDAMQTDDFRAIQCPVVIGLGALDNMVSAAESEQIAALLPAGRFELLAACKHPFEQVDLAALARRLEAFFR